MQTSQAKSHSPTTPTKAAEPPQKAAVSAASASRVPAWAGGMNDQIPTGLVLQDASTIPGIQAKLAISQPNDPYEQEADRVAEQVMRMPASPAPTQIQRKCACGGIAGPTGECEACAAKRKALQRQATKQTSETTAPPIVNQVLSSGNSLPLDVETRAFMEPSFGTDFSQVRVHTDGQAAESAQSVSALAYTVGSDVVFGNGQYRPKTSEGQKLLAHELTHVVQQGERVTRAGPGISTGPGVKSIQRFSPPGHREATIAGLKDNFSAEDIGLIETANWERDFSQGSPKIANVVIAWQAVKQSAAHNGGIPSQESVNDFRTAVSVALKIGYLEAASDQSLGGYKSWEHMDNPGGAAEKDANLRWYGKEWKERIKEGALPGYILDSKAYSKDNIVAAVDAYRKEKHTGGGISASIDNWKGVKPPKEYHIPQKETKADLEDPRVKSRVPITNEVTKMAKIMGAHASGLTLDPLTADHLGRTMHAMEDFFAHSTWLERAKALNQGRESQQPLITGTFNTPDKLQSLGYKLLTVAWLLLEDYELLQKIYHFQSEKDVRKQKNPITPRSITMTGELIDVIHAGHVISRRQESGKAGVEDYVASKELILELAAKGRHLVERGTKQAPETGHGKVAKDEPEEAGYREAVGLASQANRLVIAPLRTILDNPDDEAVKKYLADTLLLVDGIIAPPSVNHPLMRWLSANQSTSVGSNPAIVNQPPNSENEQQSDVGTRKLPGPGIPALTPPSFAPTQTDIPQLELTMPTPPRFGTIESMTIYGFATNKAKLPDLYEGELNHLAELLKLYREAQVHIEGHTDSIGTREYNQGLSEARAGAVKKALEQRGVESNRLITQGFGKDRPLVKERTDEDRAHNRRVEIWFHTMPPQSLSQQLLLPLIPFPPIIFAGGKPAGPPEVPGRSSEPEKEARWRLTMEFDPQVPIRVVGTPTLSKNACDYFSLPVGIMRNWEGVPTGRRWHWFSQPEFDLDLIPLMCKGQMPGLVIQDNVLKLTILDDVLEAALVAGASIQQGDTPGGWNIVAQPNLQGAWHPFGKRDVWYKEFQLLFKAGVNWTIPFAGPGQLPPQTLDIVLGIGVRLELPH